MVTGGGAYNLILNRFSSSASSDEERLPEGEHVSPAPKEEVQFLYQSRRGAAHFGHPLFLTYVQTTSYDGRTNHSLHTPYLYIIFRYQSLRGHTLWTPLFLQTTTSHDGRTYHSLHTPNLYILFRYQSPRPHTLPTPHNTLFTTPCFGPISTGAHSLHTPNTIHNVQLWSVNSFRLFV